MPLPSPKGKEDKNSFVSRCVSELTDKGEGKDQKQRVAICISKYSKANACDLTDEEAAALRKLIKE